MWGFAEVSGFVFTVLRVYGPILRHSYEGTATKSGLRNPPIKTIFIGLPCGADQCGFS